MIIRRTQYQCDFTGKKSFNDNKFMTLALYSGRELENDISDYSLEKFL